MRPCRLASIATTGGLSLRPLLERDRLWYEPHLDRIHEDAVVRRADLFQLEQIASGYPSREGFLTELTLDPPDGRLLRPALPRAVQLKACASMSAPACEG